MGRRWDLVRAAFSAPSTPEPVTRASFSVPYEPVNVLIEGLMAGIGRIDRARALTVPSVLRGRNLLCSISTLPLEAVDEDNRRQDHPLLRQIDPNVENVTTLAMTVEDLLFEAVAWWRVTARDHAGYPVSAVRYAPGQVSMTPPRDYRHGYLPSGLPTEPAGDVGIIRRGEFVWMGGEAVRWLDVVRFSSPNPPLLVAGERAIRRSIALDTLAEMYTRNPEKRGYFSSRPGEAPPADPDRILEVIDDFNEGTRAYAYMEGLELHPIQVSTPAEMLLVPQQQRAALELANAMGLDPEDLGVSTTSRTYQNAIDRRRDRINDVLAPYMRVVTDRLGMGDVTKRKVTVRWRLDDYLKADPKTRAEVQQIYAGLDATDAAEIRADEGRAPRTIAPTPAPAPAPAKAAFAREAGLTFGGEIQVDFAVDVEGRTITGLAVPFGQTAKSGGRRWRFAPGSIRYSAVNRVKLLRDHDSAQALGKAISIQETPAGIVATFKISPGARGDEALALALDGVLDGLSISVDIRDEHYRPDPQHPGAYLVSQAALREVSLTAVPAFDDSRLTSVQATRDGGQMDTCEHCGATLTPGVAHTCPTPAATGPAAPVAFSAEQFTEFMARFAGPPGTPPAEPDPGPTVVDPTRTPPPVVREALPYRVRRTFNRITGDEEFLFANDDEHVFSADLAAMARANDGDGTRTDAGRRVMGLLRAAFAEVTSGSIDELTPTIQRPDMYVDQRDYRTPLMDLVGKGAPPNGIQPFLFPKFSSAAGLVGDHVEGTEPASGSFVTTSQTVTPTAISGKASITREVWDMGGNPAVSSLIFNQMVRGWREGLESAAATFLNTLTAATDVTITTASVNKALVADLNAMVAELQFARGYDFTALVMEKVLYKAAAAAVDDHGRPLLPIINPSNANGRAASRFQTLDIAGVIGIPSWALASTAGAPNNSWLFDPSTVHGWWTAPQRLEFPGSDPGAATAPNAYAPVAYVDLAIWGYKAFANSDIGGVRQVIYDNA
jgi:HK97 family phage prohead protease